jgi:uncharacterized membrane protein
MMCLDATMAKPLIGIILIPVFLLAVLSLVPLFTRPSRRPSEGRWRGGIFYVNPDDPALFVPKRYGIGYLARSPRGFAPQLTWLNAVH